jgi:biopolymer transport protein ExbD
MNFRSKNKVNADANTSSMTDLVFLLLIYFVILATQITPGINVNLPKGKVNSRVPPAPTDVSVDANGQHYVDRKPVQLDQLETAMRESLSKNPEKPSVVLHIDETVPTGVTVHILDVCKMNDWKVAIATKRE